MLNRKNNNKCDNRKEKKKLTVRIAWTRFATSSRQQDRLLARWLWTFVFDVSTLDTRHNSSFLLNLKQLIEEKKIYIKINHSMFVFLLFVF